jgi:DNA-binding beta-propeller fold protein YncE
VAVTPDGTSAFACNITTNTVHVISTLDFSVTTISNVGEQPHGVIFTPDGLKAYITTENTFSPDPPHHPTSGSAGVSFVYIIDVPTLAILKAIEVGGVSQGLAFAP